MTLNLNTGTGRHPLAAALVEGAAMTKLVCAWCDVYCRTKRNTRDESGAIICASTFCAYCGRTELRFGKLGHQTPIPDDKPAWRVAFGSAS